MKKMQKLLGSVLALGLVAALVGCGGGSGNSTSFYAGTYTGSFAGTNIAGQPVAGTFTATSDASGNLTGTVSQNGTTFPATGTINSSGTITVNTAGTSTSGAFTSVLTGELETEDGVVIGNGTFATSLATVPNVATGRFTTIRQRTTANPFVGNYSGTLTSTNPAGTTSTFTLQADNNGAIRGFVTQPGVGTYAATGVITPLGNLDIFVVSNAGGNPPQQFIEELNGNATLNGNAATIAGNYETKQGSTTVAVGTFTGTRQTAG